MKEYERNHKTTEGTEKIILLPQRREERRERIYFCVYKRLYTKDKKEVKLSQAH